MKIITEQRLIIIALLFSTILFCNFQCGEDEEDNCVENNTATFDVTIYPNTKKINQGDTLWIQTNFETLLSLVNKNEIVDIANSTCSFSVDIFEVSQNSSEIQDGIHDFEYVNELGRIYQDSSRDSSDPRNEYSGQIDFSCEESNCIFKIGMIPKSQGYFCVKLGVGHFGIENYESECDLYNRFELMTFDVNDHNWEYFDILNLDYLYLRSSGGTSAVINVEDSKYALYIFEVE